MTNGRSQILARETTGFYSVPGQAAIRPVGEDFLDDLDFLDHLYKAIGKHLFDNLKGYFDLPVLGRMDRRMEDLHDDFLLNFDDSVLVLDTVQIFDFGARN